MFANFTVTNLVASEGLHHALGFITLATIPGMDGKVQLVHLRRMRYQDILMTAGAGTGNGPSITFDAGVRIWASLQGEQAVCRVLW